MIGLEPGKSKVSFSISHIDEAYKDRLANFFRKLFKAPKKWEAKASISILKTFK